MFLTEGGVKLWSNSAIGKYKNTKPPVSMQPICCIILNALKLVRKPGRTRRLADLPVAREDGGEEKPQSWYRARWKVDSCVLRLFALSSGKSSKNTCGGHNLTRLICLSL